MRFEQKTQTHGVPGSTAHADRHVDLVSTHVNYQPHARDQYSVRLATRRSVERFNPGYSVYRASLVQWRWTGNFHPRWDVGLQGGYWFDDRGATQQMLGTELGYQVGAGVWLSVGYNAVGLCDPDLNNSDPLGRGAYVRLRFKFDERLLLSASSALRDTP